MAKKQSLIPPVAPVAEEILREPANTLALEQRVELRTMFATPVMRQAWKNARASKPSAFTLGLDSALCGIIASNRLHEIRGWELCEAALLKQANEPKPATFRPPESYPASGADIVPAPRAQ